TPGCRRHHPAVLAVALQPLDAPGEKQPDASHDGRQLRARLDRPQRLISGQKKRGSPFAASPYNGNICQSIEPKSVPAFRAMLPAIFRTSIQTWGVPTA